MSQSSDDARRYVQVICPTCRAVLNPRVEKAGRRVRCPDCYSAVLVPHPPAEASPPPRRDPGQYAVSDGGPPRPQPPTFLFLCPTCQARLHPRLDMVGRRVRCPDCGSVIRVPPPPPKPEAAEPPPPLVEYRVGEEPQRAEPQFEILTVKSHSPAEPVAAPPRWWLVDGVFGFPWRPDARGRWGVLSLLILAAGEVTALMLVSTGFLSGEMDQLHAVAMGFFGLGAIWLWVWALLYGSTCFVGIIDDTGGGSEGVSQWPADDWREWLWPLLYVAFQAALAFVVGYAALWAAAHWYDAQTSQLIMAATAFLLFPILLLSAMESGETFVPFSPAIFASLFRLAWAWLLVYIESFVVVGAVAAMTAWLVAFSPYLAVPFCAPLIAASLFIVARLYGRLVWRIGHSPSREKRGPKHSSEKAQRS